MKELFNEVLKGWAFGVGLFVVLFIVAKSVYSFRQKQNLDYDAISEAFERYIKKLYSDESYEYIKDAQNVLQKLRDGEYPKELSKYRVQKFPLRDELLDIKLHQNHTSHVFIVKGLKGKK